MGYINMNAKNIVLILVCVFSILLSSCKNEINYTDTYTASKIETGNIRLFTKYGELKNSTQIKNFISNHQSFFDLKYERIIESYLGKQSQITFLSSESALLKFTESTQVSVLQKGNLVYLEQKDTFKINMSIYDFSYSQPNLNEAMKSYKELFRDTVQVIDSSNLYSIRMKLCAYFNFSDSRLKMPIMNYWLIQPFGYQSGGLINNTFNINCTKLLSDTDTLAIQQNQLVFK